MTRGELLPSANIEGVRLANGVVSKLRGYSEATIRREVNSILTVDISRVSLFRVGTFKILAFDV
jgi:hypothetical protein